MLAWKVCNKGIPLRCLEWIRDEPSFQHLKEELPLNASQAWCSASPTSFLSSTAVKQLHYCSPDLAPLLKWSKGTFSFSSKYSGDERLRINGIRSNKYICSVSMKFWLFFYGRRRKETPHRPGFVSDSLWESRAISDFRAGGQHSGMVLFAQQKELQSTRRASVAPAALHELLQ